MGAEQRITLLEDYDPKKEGKPRLPDYYERTSGAEGETEKNYTMEVQCYNTNGDLKDTQYFNGKFINDRNAKRFFPDSVESFGSNYAKILCIIKDSAGKEIDKALVRVQNL